MIHFDDTFLTVLWDEPLQCVVMQWKAYVQGEGFQRGLNAGLDLIVKKKASRWLAEMTHMQVIALADQTWANEDWFPRAIAGGIRKMALVYPKSALAKMGVKNIMTKVSDESLQTHYFEDVASARLWLGE